MRKMARGLVGLLLVTVVVAACGKDDQGPKIPSASGSWSGNVAGATFQLTLNEDEDNRLDGSGSMSASSAAIALTASGRHVHPNVTLTLEATGYQDMNFSGRFSGDDTIIGSLNGSGFVNESLTFSRR